MADKKMGRPTDRLLLAEVVLAGIFLVMLFALYLIPAFTDRLYRPGIWRWVAVAVPFFGALYLEARRRSHMRRSVIRDVIEEDRQQRRSDENASAAEPPETEQPPSR